MEVDGLYSVVYEALPLSQYHTCASAGEREETEWAEREVYITYCVGRNTELRVFSSVQVPLQKRRAHDPRAY